eukprot:scaffold29930_cov32-Phaeocystis_antarctica.AAC.1
MGPSLSAWLGDLEEKKEKDDTRNPDLCEISLVLAKVSNPLLIHRPLLGAAQCVRRARATIAGQTKNGKNPRIQP